MFSFVAAGRRIHSVRYGPILADYPHKRIIIYNESIHGTEEHAT